MAKQRTNSTKPSNGANLGFEQKLWSAADKLRGHMDASECKHVVLGLIFLKYISDAFEERHAELQKEKHADPEDRDEYAGGNVCTVRAFALPLDFRFSEQDSFYDRDFHKGEGSARFYSSNKSQAILF